MKYLNKSLKGKESLKLTRRGYFKTKNFTSTQCTVEGQETYWYACNIDADYVLDEQGFLIDHNNIHKAIKRHIKHHPMYSCEVMSRTLAHITGNMLVKYGCIIKSIDFTIIPVDKELLIKNTEGNLVAKDPLKMNFLMPANATYKLILNE